MNNNTFIHKYLKPLINEKDICVDMTLGNGNDTYFLASLAKKVYAFDIQKEAILISQNKCQDFNNIIYILDNHQNIDKYLKEPISLFIFNLGYLPNSLSTITTNPNSSLIAFKKAYEYLKEDGYLVITFYLKQENGLNEYYELSKYIHQNNLLILEKYHQDKLFAPITYIIKK